MDTIRIGILGCGPRGIQMAWVTKLIPEYFTLTCMSDPDNNALESAQKNFPEIKLFQSSDELLDSGLADALSTALFLLPLDQGKALAAQCDVEVLWVVANQQEYSTPGLDALIRT